MSARPGIPRELSQAPLRTVRPRDARGVYRDPHPQFARLARAGVLLRMIVMGGSAARVHGAIPRAVGVATVAVPRQHRPLTLEGLGGGVVYFVKRDLDRLGARQGTLDDLGRGLVTTPEQTALDLVRPRDHHLDVAQVLAAVRNLMPLCDPDILAVLAAGQRMRTALTQLRQVAP